MKYTSIGTMNNASRYVLGCMRINGVTPLEAEELIKTALENGINFFDHADIYGGGECEKIFARCTKGIARESMYLQSKCGIAKGYYDSSCEYILKAVDGILSRLKTDYLDALLIHRPDALVEPDEVARAFALLTKSGKVKNFGVSNHSPMQIELLNKRVKFPLVINQLQYSAAFTGMVDSGINVNMKSDSSIDRDGSVLDYCRFNEMTIQAWSPMQFGFFEGVFVGSDKFKPLNAVLDELAAKYDVSPTAIAIAWINTHPAKMQTILGTTNKERIKQICAAADITLTKQEWYSVYKAAGNKLP